VGKVFEPYKFQAWVALKSKNGLEKRIYNTRPQSCVPWQVDQNVLSIRSCQEIRLDNELHCAR